MMAGQTPYPWSVLDLHSLSTPKEVRTQYYALSLTQHPDKNPGDEGSTVRMQQINSAFEECLKEATRNAESGLFEGPSFTPANQAAGTSGFSSVFGSSGSGTSSGFEATSSSQRPPPAERLPTLDGLRGARTWASTTVARILKLRKRYAKNDHCLHLLNEWIVPPFKLLKTWCKDLVVELESAGNKNPKDLELEPDLVANIKKNSAISIRLMEQLDDLATLPLSEEDSKCKLEMLADIAGEVN